MAVEQLRRKRSHIEGQRSITSQQIARFFESVEGEELLRTQRLKDAARRQIIQAAGSEAEAINPIKIEPVQPAATNQQVAGQAVTLSVPDSDSVFADF